MAENECFAFDFEETMHDVIFEMNAMLNTSGTSRVKLEANSNFAIFYGRNMVMKNGLPFMLTTDLSPEIAHVDAV